ncbi:hypothetical protein BC937DRAFT_87715, partial [Endogone sp. FLAS-F59071]
YNSLTIHNPSEIHTTLSSFLSFSFSSSSSSSSNQAAMSQQPPIVIFHYTGSAYCMKVLWALQFKGLGYHSVFVAPVLPRPEVEALAHGYRKVPVMSIGADVYCDTKRILQELENRFPEPSLYPPRTGTSDKIDRGVTDVISFWTDVIISLKITCITQCSTTNALFCFTNAHLSSHPLSSPEHHLPSRRCPHALYRPHFQQSPVPPGPRQPFRSLAAQPAVKEQLLPHLHTIEKQLADGRIWLLDTAVPGLADIHVAMNVWFVEFLGKNAVAAKVPGGARDVFNPQTFPRTFEWIKRFNEYIDARKVKVTKCAGAEALEFARQNPPAELRAGTGLFRSGQRVSVVPTDYGKIPVKGTLVKMDEAEIVVRNEGEGVPVHIHFPRIGFVVSPEANL